MKFKAKVAWGKCAYHGNSQQLQYVFSAINLSSCSLFLCLL